MAGAAKSQARPGTLRKTALSVCRLAVGGEKHKAKSALDQLLWREQRAANLAGKQPDYYSPGILDEV